MRKLIWWSRVVKPPCRPELDFQKRQHVLSMPCRLVVFFQNGHPGLERGLARCGSGGTGDADQFTALDAQPRTLGPQFLRNGYLVRLDTAIPQHRALKLPAALHQRWLRGAGNSRFLRGSLMLNFSLTKPRQTGAERRIDTQRASPRARRHLTTTSAEVRLLRSKAGSQYPRLTTHGGLKRWRAQKV